MWYRKRTNEITPAVNPILKFILFFFSVLYWIAGLCLILVGVYACAEKGLIISDFYNLITDPAIIILVFGCGLFFLTFFACVGALRENVCMLRFFSIVLAISLFFQFVAGFVTVVLYDHVEDAVKSYLGLMIENYRDDPDRQNIVDWGQEEFKCCGVNDYKDWGNNMYFACTESNPSYERCSVPWSCCRFSASITVKNTLCGIGVLDLTKVDADKVVHTVGCVPTLVNWVYNHVFILACLAVGVAIPQIVGVCISRILLLQIKDQKIYDKVPVQNVAPDTAVEESEV